MNKRPTLVAIAFAALCVAAPMAARAGVGHEASLVMTAYDVQQGWGGRHKDRDGGRSNWSNGSGDSNNHNDSGKQRQENWMSRIDEAYRIAGRYPNVSRVENVSHENGPFFHGRVTTRDGRRVDLRINVDSGSYSEE